MCDNKGSKYASNNMGSKADFPKLAAKIPPILHVLFQYDPDTPYQEVEADFSALKSELALVTELKPVRPNRSDSMRLLRVRGILAVFILASWNVCSSKTPPYWKRLC